MVIAEQEPDTKQMKVVAPATILLCAWRNIVCETAECLMSLRDQGWGYVIKRGDALISRSRAKVVSDWYKHTNEDVFLMIDDDVVFEGSGAASVVQLARDTRSVVCAAYPVKDGGHLACRRFLGQDILFGAGSGPVEIVYPATGFMAVHRDVITAMIEAVDDKGEPLYPYCEIGGDYWPIFDPLVIKHEDGRYEDLSEDYAFGERARRLGFKVWLDPSVILYHMGVYPYTIENMKHVINTCGDCGEALDKDGNGHRLDCSTQMREINLTTARGHKLTFDAQDGVLTKAVETTGVWEEPVAQAIEDYLKPGWTFLDLGAHVGYFSVIAAARGANVIAVEANARYERLLRENMLANGYTVESHAVAVGDRDGDAFLHPDRRTSGHPSAAHIDPVSGVSVPMVQLPSILHGRTPEFIKLDIEGMEAAVIEASFDAFMAAKVVVFEVGPAMCDRFGTTPQKVIDLVRSHGFYVTHVSGQELPDDFAAGMRVDQYANLLGRRLS